MGGPIVLEDFKERVILVGVSEQDIDIALHELAVSSSLRTVCTPYITDLQCLER